jgi:hypothetical protein
VIGLILIPLIAIYIVYQPVNAYLSYINTEVIRNIVTIGLLGILGIFVSCIVLQVMKWRSRSTSVSTGSILMTFFLVFAVLVKYLTAFYATVVTGTPLEMIGIFSALFGLLVYLVSFLGTSMINPHWRE